MSKKVEDIYEDIITHFISTCDPIELIQVGCQRLDWNLAIENTDGDDTLIRGFIIGEEDWIEEHTLDTENFDIVAYEEEE